ncbi:U1 small nuclear ribonucleoprotein component SNU71 [Frankliniella fusca]|uniref:U1 small nuclear ribonucleoprotein component SNU71 n=1 Tax=Frankliniella fusca TaxID=407009 RepID=A0AAE1HGW2_9NEOP|nr:U1 small nuclear ribonucleoprotein component SNU71 [Frankliniella fusca]
MEDKVPYSYDLIRPERVYKAAEFLDAENPIEVITVDNENISSIGNTEDDFNEVIDTNIKQNECSSSSDSSDSETETGNHETMVMPDILPDHITNDIGIKIAPGENQIPISLLQNEDVDILTYPSIYCGEARQFKHKLTDTQLRKFELKSSDRRAAKHIPKLFMSFCKSRLHELDSHERKHLKEILNKIKLDMEKIAKRNEDCTFDEFIDCLGLDEETFVLAIRSSLNRPTLAINTRKKISHQSTQVEQDIENSLSHDEENEQDEDNSKWIALQNNAGYIKLRSKPKTIRFRNNNLIDDEYNYYREQVMLYHPWRSEQSIIDNATTIYAKNLTNIEINRQKYNFKMSINLDETIKEINTHTEDGTSDDETNDIGLSDDFKIFELGAVDSDIALEIPTMTTDDDTLKFGTFTVPKSISNEE